MFGLLTLITLLGAAYYTGKKEDKIKEFLAELLEDYGKEKEDK